VSRDADETSIRAAALELEVVARHLDGREPKKVIVVPGRVVNVVG
jgi:leucyl-tRNA synthetase